MGTKKTEQMPDKDLKKIIKGTSNNKWELAKASNEQSLIELLDADYEPFSVDNGVVWFRKK